MKLRRRYRPGRGYTEDEVVSTFGAAIKVGAKNIEGWPYSGARQPRGPYPEDVDDTLVIPPGDDGVLFNATLVMIMAHSAGEELGMEGDQLKLFILECLTKHMFPGKAGGGG